MIRAGAKAAAAITRIVAALFFIVGIVLSPLRAVAAPFPMLFAYDVAVRPTTTTVLGAHEAVRSEAERPRFNDYECMRGGYDDPSNAPVMAGAGGVHAYDDALELLERRELAKAAIYGFVEPTAAAEGVETASTYVYRLVDEAGDPVYYGISNDPARRLAEHAAEGAFPFNGMQVISDAQPLAQARALESSLIQGAVSEGRTIYNVAPNSISPLIPVQVPSTVPPLQTLLNPKLY